MSHARYAIYLAPHPDSPLWRFGSLVLGYDAASGEDCPGFSLPGIPAAQWHRITERPRTYGFHATLKAPFRLAPDCKAEHLVAALSTFAAHWPAFDLGPLAVTSLSMGGGGFVALTPSRAPGALGELEAGVVTRFDRFRAPLTAAEREARHPERLTKRELESLDRWGYPHVMEDYRCHFTLTGHLPEPERIADQLADAMAAKVGTAHPMVDALVLFEQPAPGQRFTIKARLPLRAKD
jgi:Protein of unknown function (DUF1045)